MGSAEGTPAEPRGAARRLVDLLLTRPPTLGEARLLCVDGPAGSGKTTLAGAVADDVGLCGRSVQVVHMDDLYDGWQGLHASGELLREGILRPLSQGRPGRFRRYDWHREQYADTRTVTPADVLVVEGVGSWRREHARLVTLLAWVEAPAEVRVRRWHERDGTDSEPYRVRWALDEEELHRVEETRAAADVVVDGTGPR